MRDRDSFRYIHEVPTSSRVLSRSDLRQIDTWVAWWFDTDSLFGQVNAGLGALGALGGLIWALASAFATELTLGSVILMPLFALFAGWLAGTFAVAGVAVWLLWMGGASLLGLF